MSFSIAPMLIHSSDISPRVRAAIADAYSAAPDQRTTQLEAAARLLHRDTGLECEDVRELIGLPGGC